MFDLDYIQGLAILAAYFGSAYFLIRLIIKWAKPLSQNWRIVTLSFSYSLIFGIGLLGGEGDPGFAFPCPIVVAGIFDIWFWTSVSSLITGVIIPFAFWWAIIYLIMLYRHKNSKRSHQ
jgi:hypothetical protein